MRRPPPYPIPSHPPLATPRAAAASSELISPARRRLLALGLSLGSLSLAGGLLTLPGCKESKPEAVHTPYEALTAATTFAIGGVGFAGTISPAEKDFRALLQEPDAVEKCRKLLTDATPEGQMYGLLGLKLKDETAFVAALPQYKGSKTKLREMAGCMMGTTTMGELSAMIEKGSYK